MEGRKERERGKRRERKKEIYKDKREQERKTSELKCNFDQLKKLGYSALNLWGNR